MNPHRNLPGKRDRNAGFLAREHRLEAIPGYGRHPRSVNNFPVAAARLSDEHQYRKGGGHLRPRLVRPGLLAPAPPALEFPQRPGRRRAPCDFRDCPWARWSHHWSTTGRVASSIFCFSMIIGSADRKTGIQSVSMEILSLRCPTRGRTDSVGHVISSQIKDVRHAQAALD